MTTAKLDLPRFFRSGTYPPSLLDKIKRCLADTEGGGAALCRILELDFPANDHTRCVESVQMVRDELVKLEEKLAAGLARPSTPHEELSASESKKKQDHGAKLRQEVNRLYKTHRNDKDGYVFPVCAGLDEADIPILPAWQKEMQRLGIPAKQWNWMEAYGRLRHRVEAQIGRKTKYIRGLFPPGKKPTATHAHPHADEKRP